MKKNIFLAAVITMMSLQTTNSLHAQSGSMGGENTYKMLADTSYCKVTETTFLPGVKTDTHTHPAHFFYALTDGTVDIHYADGEVVTYSLKKGEYALAPPERPHWTVNTGRKPIQVLLVEFPEHPYMDKKMGSMK